jgi:hypothetical protein
MSPASVPPDLLRMTDTVVWFASTFGVPPCDHR